MSLNITTKGNFTFDVIPGFTKPQNLRAYYLFGGSIESTEKNRSTYFNEPLIMETPMSIDEYSVDFGRAGYGTTEIPYEGGSYTMLAVFRGATTSGSGAITSIMSLPKTDHPNRDRLYMMQERVTVWHNGSSIGTLEETYPVTNANNMTILMSYDEPSLTITVKTVINGGEITTHTYNNVAPKNVDPGSVFMVAYPDEGDGEGNWFLTCYWDTSLDDNEADRAVNTARRVVNNRVEGF